MPTVATTVGNRLLSCQAGSCYVPALGFERVCYVPVQSEARPAGRRTEYELTQLSARLVEAGPDSIDAAIEAALASFGDRLQAHRCYLFLFDEKSAIAENTHEWCAAGVESQQDQLRRVQMDRDFPWSAAQLRAGRMVYVPDVAALDKQTATDHRAFEDLALKSLLMAPLMAGQKLIGIIGVDDVQQAREWSADEQRLLKVAGALLTHSLLRVRAEQALRDSEARYRALVDHSPSIIFASDSDGRLTFLSASTRSLLGFEPDELIDTRLCDLIHVDDVGACRQHIQQLVAGEPVESALECRFRRKDETLAWHRLVLAPLKDGQNRLVSLIGNALDISQAKAAEARLRLAASVFTHSHEGILITDARSKIIEVNEAFTRITGYSREEVLGRKPSLLQSGRQGELHYQRMWQSLREDGYWSGELWNRRRDGEFFAEFLTISAVRNDQGRVVNYVGLFSDITSQKLHQQRLEQIAHYDALTGLPNRVLLADRLRQAMSQVKRHGMRLAVAYVDLDGFKDINDSYGHEVGDHFLSAVGERMQSSLRDIDTVARLGGDEFVVVMSDLEDAEVSERLLERLSRALSEPLPVQDRSLPLAASIGVTFYPQGEELDADQLIRQADQAMYEAKHRGKGHLRFFDAELDRQHREHADMLRRLHQALDSNELLLHYQPIIELDHGKVYGFEALLRWQHPDRGLLMPADFLELVRGEDLMHKIERWVLKTALKDLKGWRDSGIELDLSINISGQQLLHHDFLEWLERQMSRHAWLSPGDLCLEIQESSIMLDVERTVAVIQACSAMGVSFALDDFGTGYSSMSTLKQLPLRQVKIDQHFIKDMLEDPDDLAIAKGIIELGRAFAVEVVAEGVESVEQVRTLSKLGCALAQGFVIARPMSAGQVPKWLNQWQSGSEWLSHAVM
jgi:diguanylate cyclase (GGDEF)-like protein/PAS domain S-box-containing protein